MAGAVVAFCNKTRVLLQPRRAPHMQTSVCVAHFFTSIVRIARSIFDPVPPTVAVVKEEGGTRERESVHDLQFLRTDLEYLGILGGKFLKYVRFARR